MMVLQGFVIYSYIVWYGWSIHSFNWNGLDKFSKQVLFMVTL